MSENYTPPKDPIKLEDWSTIFTDPDPYKPPELQVMRLHGKAYGHPRHEDGKEVVTSRVVDLDLEGRSAKTRSGSTYTLGEPAEGFVKYLKDTNRQDLLSKMGL